MPPNFHGTIASPNLRAILQSSDRFYGSLTSAGGVREVLFAALATVVGVLVEVPLMLSVVRIVNRTKNWYERA